MKHRLIKTLLVFLVIVGICAGFIFYSIYIAPSTLKITNKTISSTSIPESLDDVTIGYISDIEYGEFMDIDRLSKMIDKINNANPDVILFGGDLFADPTNAGQNSDEINNITNLLSSIKAPLGKFYVLGEKDLTNEDTKTFVSTILYNSGFENLTNISTRIHNGKSEFINLIGLDSKINGTPNIQSAFTNINSNTFNVVFTHVPDELAEIPEGIANLALAGHSRGGQISLPFIGNTTTIEGAQKYESGIYYENNLEICISNGLGTNSVDMRLFSPAEIVVYRLIHK